MDSIESKKITAVIVTYNRHKLLERCIKAVLGQKNISCDVLIIDNGSTDGTADFIQNEYSGRREVLYINTGKNTGGAGGFYIGIREAVKLGYEYIWMMDDDVIPQETTLAMLFTADQRLDGRWGFLSSVAYWTDDSICRMNIQKRTIFRHIGPAAYQEELVPIKMCSFVSLLLKTSVVKEVGLPIREYFIWTDDYEYTGRISRRYPCYMIPGSKVCHSMQKNIRPNFAVDDKKRFGRYWYLYRNDVHCYRQYGLIGWSYIILKDFYTILNILINSKERKKDKIKVMIQGFLEGVRFNPRIEMMDKDGG